MFRGDTDGFAELGGEVALVGKSDLVSHLCGGQGGEGEKEFGAIDAALQDIAVGRMSDGVFEGAGKVELAHGNEGGKGSEGEGFGKMVFDVVFNLGDFEGIEGGGWKGGGDEGVVAEEVDGEEVAEGFNVEGSGDAAVEDFGFEELGDVEDGRVLEDDAVLQRWGKIVVGGDRLEQSGIKDEVDVFAGFVALVPGELAIAVEENASGGEVGLLRFAID